jgi:hypothetical protein
MFNLLLTPGAPFFALSIAGAFVAALGLTQIIGRRNQTIAFPTAVPLRLALGQAAAIPITLCLILAAVAGGMQGEQRTLLLASALALYLGVGIVLPRRPLAQAAAERAQLRRLTPGFVSFVRVALAGFDAPAAVLARYVTRPRHRLLPMQRVVAEAITLAQEQRLRPFEALRRVARTRSCRELIEVAETLAQAEAEGNDVGAALLAHQETLEAILRDEFTRSLRRRALYLLGFAAISLIIGVLGNILFVMTGGGRILMQ